MEPIDYHSAHRLGDTLALQLFILRHHLMRRALILAAAMLVSVGLITVTSGAPIQDSLEDLSQISAGIWRIFFGLVAIHVSALPKRGFPGQI